MARRTNCSFNTIVIAVLFINSGCPTDKTPSDAAVYDRNGEANIPDGGMDAPAMDAQGDACPSGIVCEKCDCSESGNPCFLASCDFGTSTCMYTLLDNDGDGHAPLMCSMFGGDDCDDTNSAIHPGAKEICDGADNDCNEQIDEALSDCE